MLAITEDDAYPWLIARGHNELRTVVHKNDYAIFISSPIYFTVK
jgi:hypothetical protein